MYDHDEWRALSRRLALKVPFRPPARSSLSLFAACAILLIIVGALIRFGYWD